MFRTCFSPEVKPVLWEFLISLVSPFEDFETDVYGEIVLNDTCAVLLQADQVLFVIGFHGCLCFTSTLALMLVSINVLLI